MPIGPVPSTINLNADYAPAQWRGWGASVQWTWLSSRDVANLTDASGLTSSSRYLVLSQLRRNYLLTAAIDF
jgi:hypothetical protein